MIVSAAPAIPLVPETDSTKSSAAALRSWWSPVSDIPGRRVLVAESVTPVKGVMTFGPTKGHERREVPLPRFLIEDLARHVAGKAPERLVFTGARGAVMRNGTFQRGALIEAAKSIGVPGFHPHELRHTAASLAIASGADVKVVQQMLGHKMQ
jgi:integrase